MTEVEKNLQSANFKRDYVTLSAIGLFLLTLAVELVLTFGIPLSFNRANLYAEQEARQRMHDRFDFVRNLSRKNPENYQAKHEMQLIEWDLNLLKDFLAEYSITLDTVEINQISQVLDQYQLLLNRFLQLDVANRVKTFDRQKQQNFQNRQFAALTAAIARTLEPDRPITPSSESESTL